MSDGCMRWRFLRAGKESAVFRRTMGGFPGWIEHYFEKGDIKELTREECLEYLRSAEQQTSGGGNPAGGRLSVPAFREALIQMDHLRQSEKSANS